MNLIIIFKIIIFLFFNNLITTKKLNKIKINELNNFGLSDGMIKQPCKIFPLKFKNINLTYYCIENDKKQSCKPNTKLLIIIPIRRNSFNERDNIRKSYLIDKINGTEARFFISDPEELIGTSSMEEQQELREEQLKFGDLIFIHGFKDLYKNLHFKMLAAFNWNKEFCPQANWTLKIDSDMVVNLKRLDYWIKEKFSKELIKNEDIIFGRLFIGSPRINDPINYKYYVSIKDFKCPFYPPYMSGPSYLLTKAAILKIVKYSSYVKAIHIEDVLFTGIIAKKAKIARSGHWNMFNTFEYTENNECENCIPLLITTIGNYDINKRYEELNNINCV